VALYLIKRIVLTIPVLFATALMIFFLFQMIPGDVVQASMTQKLMTAEQQDAIREALGLNKPVLERAGDYAVALMQGDMGRSFRTGQPVVDMLLSQLPYTVILIAWSLLLAVLIGIPLGLAAALRRNSSVDAAAMTAAVLGASIPQYWFGLVLILVFAVNLKWLPATGSSGFDTLILPAITLGVGNAAIIAPDAESLQLRWRKLIRAKPEQKEELFHPHLRGGRARKLAPGFRRAVVGEQVH